MTMILGPYGWVAPLSNGDTVKARWKCSVDRCTVTTRHEHDEDADPVLERLRRTIAEFEFRHPSWS